MLDQDWAELAFASKKPLSNLKATFIAAPRSISQEYFKELVKTYLPGGNIIVGIAKETYIDGFDNQPQFHTLQQSFIQPILDKINNSKSPHKVHTLHYFQRELKYILEKVKFKQVLFINGSWRHTFHTLEPFYILHKEEIAYKLIPAFKDETDALAYDQWFSKNVIAKFTHPKDSLDDRQMLDFINRVASLSFDYNFQTGSALAKNKRGKYQVLAHAYNRVVPYQTYAMLHGASRETNFAPPNDLNHYDTVHAEVEMIIHAQKTKLDLKDTSLFVNLMPCPPCARMLSESDIKEIVYHLDHSDGYAVQLLEAAGKKVRRITT